MELHRQRAWGWADWFVVGFRLFGFVISLSNIWGADLQGRQGFALSFALLSLAIPQLFYLPGHIRPRAFIAAEIVLSGGFMIYLAPSIPDAKSYFLIPLFVISFLCTKKIYYVAGPLCLLGFPLVLATVGNIPLEVAMNFALNMLVFSAFGFGFGVFLRQKDQLAVMLQMIEEKNRALEHSLQQVERVTLLEERSRMSRELHDTVGHSLTASIVAMEAVQALIDRDPQSAKERLQQLIHFSRGHLDQFRRTVHDMAMNELKQPLGELLRTAAESFSNQTGTHLILDFGTTSDRPSPEIPEVAKLAMLRCMQEALTNAKKHGAADEIRIRLEQADNGLSLTIQDNGRGTDTLVEGFGLEGMKARVEALRGTLRIASRPGAGTSVFCEIPMGGMGEWSR